MEIDFHLERVFFTILPVLNRRATVFTVFFLVCFWAALVYALAPQWSADEQYFYGWGVPFLCMYLGWQRWSARPAAQPPARAGLGLLIIVTALVLLLPIRLIHEPNPGWWLTTLLWTLTVEVVSLTVLWLQGGRPWLRHLGPPIAFFLVAVPWPPRIENTLVQGLMGLNVGATTEILGCVGIPAFQRGNVIELATGVLGVEEACSGIRSLQATVMITVFFALLYRLRFLPGLALVVIGAGLAFLCNLARTFVLSFVAGKKGVEAVANWHDPASVTILVACFISAWLVALLFARKTKTGLSSTGAPSGGQDAPSGTLIEGNASSGLNVPLAACFFGTFLLAEVGVRLWYGALESRRPLLPLWSIAAPTNNPSFREVGFTKSVKRQLKFDEGKNARWTEPDGTRVQLIYLKWNPGRIPRQHRPEVCLESGGFELVTLPGLHMYGPPGLSLCFREFRINTGAQRGYVFYARRGARGENETEWEGESVRMQKLNAVMRGRGTQGLQVLEIVFWNIPDQAAAEAELQRQVESLVKVEEIGT